MLANRYRFHGHGSLRFVYAKGSVVRSRYFVCKYTNNKHRSEPRIAVVVSKKVIKSAVKRNRIRRRVYEAIRLELPKINKQLDLVIIVVSPELVTLPYDEIQQLIGSSFGQAGLYKTLET